MEFCNSDESLSLNTLLFVIYCHKSGVSARKARQWTFPRFTSVIFLFNAVAEEANGPFYTQMGTFKSVEDLRKYFEDATGFTGNQVRIEKLTFVPQPGTNDLGCPIAKQVSEKLPYFVSKMVERICV